jgi:uncharacterized membrane protein SpoIIM required for sporulation
LREVAFIAQNKQNWRHVEQVVAGKLFLEPDELLKSYNKVIADLSYAKTYYPKSEVTPYLNYLVTQLHLKVYRKRKLNLQKILNLLKYEIPLLSYAYRKYFYFAFALFFAFLSIGILSSIFDEPYVRYVMGPGYVETTLDNISKGNPVSIYKSGSDWGSFVGIAFNNLRVGAIMYMGGFLLGMGTLYILFSNAVMVGAFQTMFYLEGVLLASMQGIWIHGSMEIFGMVIEAALGFVLAASFIFPGTYRRFASFKIGFKNTFKIYLSTIPFTIAAAFLEGYVTRFAMEMGGFFAALIIFSTLGLISYYYLIYPILLNRKTQINHLK